MIKKGLKLFISTGYALEKTHTTEIPCCDVCTTVLPMLCLFICKYRKATMKEWDTERRSNNDNR